MKAIRKIAKMPTKNNHRIYSSVVNVTDDYIEYTDGSYLIRVKKNDFDLASGCYSKDEMAKELMVPGSAKAKYIHYPNTESIIPQDTEHVIVVNGHYLENILKVICSDSKTKAVEISIKNDVLIVTCEGNTGIAAGMKEDR